MKQAVALYDLEPFPVFNPMGRKLNAHGRLAWLHRLLWRALEKMGALADHFHETTAYRRVIIDEDRLFDRVRHALQMLAYRNERPREILMGPETFSELMSSPEARDHMHTFSFTTQGRKLMGLPVSVLPWMEGLLVR